MNGKSILARLRLGANPIVVKELRSRMRGARAFAILTGVLLLLAGVSYVFYRIVLAATIYTSTPVSPQIGLTLLVGLAVVELLMVCFITPAVTAGAISGEVERLTYEMLLATPLRPASILWGKLISALAYVFLLILAAVPLASLIFIFGGVTLRDMIVVLVILAATAVTLGVIGITLSAWLGRTVRATVLGYMVVLGMLVGPLIVYILVGVLRQTLPPSWILIPNPVSALFSALPTGSSGGSSISFVFELGRLLGGAMAADSSRVLGPILPRPLYHYTLPAYGLLSLSLYLLATRLVRPTRRWRIHWQEALIALALFFLLGLAVATPFVLTADRYERRTVKAVPTPFPFEGPPLPPGVAIERAVVVVESTPLVPPLPTPAPTPTPTPVPTAEPEESGGTPSAAAPSTPTAAPDLSEADQAAIYAAVIRQLYTVDHTFDRAPNFPTVYLVRRTEESSHDPRVPQTESQVLSQAVQTAIVDMLTDLPAEFIWTDDRQEIPLDPKTGVVPGDGAIFTVGNIYLDENHQALVPASLYFANLGAGGQTYVLEQVGGAWQITGDTGTRWIS